MKHGRVIRITPELAKLILEHYNQANREVKSQQVAALAAEMQAGNFISMNGDTIRFHGTLNTKGAPITLGMVLELLDGQHRLLAIIASGMAFDFLVVDGLDRKIFGTIDKGVKRTTRDHFRTEFGKQVPTIMAPIVAKYLKTKIAQDFFKQKEEGKITGKKRIRVNLTSSNREFKITDPVIAETYKVHKMVFDSIYATLIDHSKNLKAVSGAKYCSYAAWTILHSPFKDRAMKEFWMPLLSGTNVDNKPWVIFLRNALSRESGKQGRKANEMTMVGWIIKAYENHFNTVPFTDKAGEHLKYRTDSQKTFFTQDNITPNIEVHDVAA